MKLAIASDLHLEFADLVLLNQEKADVLVLAGDICTLRHLETQGKLNQRFRDFFSRVTHHYSQVLYVLGNHESYGTHIQKSSTLAYLLSQEFSNLILLEDTTITLTHLKFFGATLWTDLNRGNPQSILLAQTQMNDYKVIRTGDQYRRLQPHDTIQKHRATLKALHDASPSVVITHHAPSWQSISERYKGDPLNPAYVSDLNEFIEAHPQIRLWIHGHLHDAVDYQIGQTRIVSNPRGYLNIEPQAQHWAPLVVEV